MDGKYTENPTKNGKKIGINLGLNINTNGYRRWLSSRISEKSLGNILLTLHLIIQRVVPACHSLLWINHSFLLLLLEGHGFRVRVGV